MPVPGEIFFKQMGDIFILREQFPTQLDQYVLTHFACNWKIQKKIFHDMREGLKTPITAFGYHLIKTITATALKWVKSWP